MITLSKALFLIISFCLYFAIDCNCPMSGGAHSISSGSTSCTSGIIGPFTSIGSITWSDGTTTVKNTTFTATYVEGQLVGNEIGKVISGKFIGAKITTEFTFANVSLDCLLNGGIDGLSGVVVLEIVSIIPLGTFACPIGTSNISYYPPISNTPQNITITSDLDFSACIGLLIC